MSLPHIVTFLGLLPALANPFSVVLSSTSFDLEAPFGIATRSLLAELSSAHDFEPSKHLPLLRCPSDDLQAPPAVPYLRMPSRTIPPTPFERRLPGNVPEHVGLFHLVALRSPTYSL